MSELEQDVNARVVARILEVIRRPEWTPDTQDAVTQILIDAGHYVESDEYSAAQFDDEDDTADVGDDFQEEDAESPESPRAEGEATPAPARCPSCGGGGGPVADRYPDAAAVLCDRCNTDCRR